MYEVVGCEEGIVIEEQAVDSVQRSKVTVRQCPRSYEGRTSACCSRWAREEFLTKLLAFHG